MTFTKADSNDDKMKIYNLFLFVWEFCWFWFVCFIFDAAICILVWGRFLV